MDHLWMVVQIVARNAHGGKSILERNLVKACTKWVHFILQGRFFFFFLSSRTHIGFPILNLTTLCFYTSRTHLI